MKAKDTKGELEHDAGHVPNLVPLAEVEPAVDVVQSNAVPAWVRLPEGMKLPVGCQVMFLRFKPEWTCAQHLGERQCIVWPLTDLDERVAYTRIKDNFAVASSELSKQMIRAFDGAPVDWAAGRGKPGNVEDFWREIGPKCRGMVQRIHAQTHTLDPEEVAYFFEHCVAARTMG